MLRFRIEDVTHVPYAVAPTLAFALMVNADEPIDAILLHAQIRIDPTRRGYDAAAKEKLFELFGAPDDWGRTVHSLFWTHANVVIPAFDLELGVDLPVPCSFDFNIAATRYFAALGDGEIPLTFLFSGTVFQRNTEGLLQIARVSWESESSFSLPVRTWKALMDRYYPGAVWLNIPTFVFQQLDEYKRRHGLATLDQVFERLLMPVPLEAAP